jgi:hypothetical protein
LLALFSSDIVRSDGKHPPSIWKYRKNHTWSGQFVLRMMRRLLVSQAIAVRVGRRRHIERHALPVDDRLTMGDVPPMPLTTATG